jgi:hypothetical protein
MLERERVSECVRKGKGKRERKRDTKFMITDCLTSVAMPPEIYGGS